MATGTPEPGRKPNFIPEGGDTSALKPNRPLANFIPAGEKPRYAPQYGEFPEDTREICGECGKVFSARDDLMKHIEVEHSTPVREKKRKGLKGLKST